MISVMGYGIQGQGQTLRPGSSQSWEAGTRYELDVEGFPNATQAEEAGMKAAQAVLLAAISLDFGVRLNYHSHEPPTVFDRTVSSGGFGGGEVISCWPPDIVVQELTDAFSHTLKDRRLILSMELFTAASLESNIRTRFVTAVSALEPLAEQLDLGSEVGAFVERACIDLKGDSTISDKVRQSLLGQVRDLKRESVSQALNRLCERWFPGNRVARNEIVYLYRLRSQILHNGRLDDLDVELTHELQKVSKYLRQIYAKEYGIALRASVVV